LIKKSIDQLLVEKQLVETRTKAKAMIMAGQIFVDEKQINKSGEIFKEDVKIKVKNLQPEWVSRGAFKILHALNNFNIEINNKTCLDLGASTGGFSQVLLKKGAKKIYSVDVGKNQLHEKLRIKNKIINIEKTNARYLTSATIKDKIDIIVCDVSFISMIKVIEPCLKFLTNNGQIIALIKPQFEAKKKEIKKGVVLDKNVHLRICDEYKKWFEENCLMKVIGLVESPIQGPKGNKEFLICCENYKNLKQ
jgi:23S rRNA (cytidine1920-2'-O)/16S rRNA (cytidine1409-2'-O)-methyltransferase